ncbi:helix-turn-helix domain-containing protein, partial [Acinetobacter baumannii]
AANLNAIAFDYVARQKVQGQHLNWFIVEQLPVIPPAAYARALRAERTAQALSQEARVTDAIYEAGFSGPSRFYAASEERLGMTASAWVNGGRGVTIRWAVVDTSLGAML